MLYNLLTVPLMFEPTIVYVIHKLRYRGVFQKHTTLGRGQNG